MIPQKHSGGCRQGSYAVFGGCVTLSAHRAKSKAFLHFYHKTKCILNSKSIFKGNLAIVNWRIRGKKELLRKKLHTHKKKKTALVLDI